MNADRSERSPRRSIALQIAGCVLITALVYVDFWDGSLPALPEAGTLAVAVGAGALIGGGSEYVRTRSDLDIPTWLGLLLFATALGLGLLLFPNGLPVAAEFGFLAFVWASVLGTSLSAATGHANSRSSP